MALSLLLMREAATAEVTVFVLCLFWGFAVTLYNLTFQSAIIAAAPTGTAIAMSVFSGIYNVGIGSGALVGGVVCTHLTIGEIGYVGGGIALLAAAYCLWRVVPVFKRILVSKD